MSNRKHKFHIKGDLGEPLFCGKHPAKFGYYTVLQLLRLGARTIPITNSSFCQTCAKIYRKDIGK